MPASAPNNATMAAETSPELHTVPWVLVDVVILSKSITRLDHQSIFL